MNNTQTSTVSRPSFDAVLASLIARSLGDDDELEIEPVSVAPPVAVVKMETGVEKKPLPAPATKMATQTRRLLMARDLDNFIRKEAEKRERSLSPSARTWLAACEFAYRCIAQNLEHYSDKQKDALRKELLTIVGGVFRALSKRQNPSYEADAADANAWLERMRGNKPASVPPPAPPPFTTGKIQELIKRDVREEGLPLERAEWIVGVVKRDSRLTETERTACINEVRQSLVYDVFLPDATSLGEAKDMADNFMQKFAPQMMEPLARPTIEIARKFELPSRLPLKRVTPARGMYTPPPRPDARAQKVDVPTDNPGEAPTAEALAAKRQAKHTARMERQKQIATDLTAGAMKIIAKPAKSDKKEKNKKNRDK